MHNFGSVIKGMRKEKKMTQKVLAENVCSQSVLSRIENNEEIPNVIVMQQICEKLEVSIDCVMNQEHQSDNRTNEWLDLMAYYYQTKKYKDLQKLVEKEYIGKLLQTDEEMQRYYFYTASCLYRIDGDLTGTLVKLQTALKYTYTNAKKDISDMEVLLLSDIGRVYVEMGNIENGMYFLKKSVALFFSLPRDRELIELIKIFYNLASTCIDQGDYKGASDMIDQGISWARKKNSYYYLDELLLLKGIILEDHKQLEDAVKFVDMANMIKRVAYGDEIVTLNKK